MHSLEIGFKSIVKQGFRNLFVNWRHVRRLHSGFSSSSLVLDMEKFRQVGLRRNQRVSQPFQLMLSNVARVALDFVGAQA